MAWLPILGLIGGFVVGLVVFSTGHWAIPGQYAPYLSLATLAGLDTIFGGIRAGIEGRFEDDIFVSGFLLNTLLAAALAYFGDLIGVDLILAAVVALGSRIFLNLSLIRRHYLTKLALARRKETATAASPVESQSPVQS